MKYLNIASIVDNTLVEGPGLRTAIWVQGCLKRCKSCCNPEYLEIKPANIISIDNLCERILQNKYSYGIEGVTLLGGEPFLQAQGLGYLARFSQKHKLSIMIFTGYKLRELDDTLYSGASFLIKHSDIIVDGEFELHNQENSRNWVGSTNQNFHYFTDRYSEKVETTEQSTTNEWRFSSDGKIIANGLPFVIKNQ